MKKAVHNNCNRRYIHSGSSIPPLITVLANARDCMLVCLLNTCPTADGCGRCAFELLLYGVASVRGVQWYQAHTMLLHEKLDAHFKFTVDCIRLKLQRQEEYVCIWRRRALYAHELL